MSQGKSDGKAAVPRFKRRRLVAIGTALLVVAIAVVLLVALLGRDTGGKASGPDTLDPTQVSSEHDFTELPAEEDPRDVKNASRLSIYLAKESGPFVVYQQRVYDTPPLAQGKHTLTITCTGEKNPASSGNAIVVDAFDVEGSLDGVSDTTEQARFQESDSRFVYSGDWTDVADESASGGSFISTDKAGANVSITFYGTNATGGNHLAWIAETGPAYGKAQVSLDGATPVEIDLYRAWASYGIDASLPAAIALRDAVIASTEVDAATRATVSSTEAVSTGSPTASSLTFVFSNNSTLTFDLYPAENLIGRGGRVWRVDADLQELIQAVAKAYQSQAPTSP